jgi:hypothetical protein
MFCLSGPARQRFDLTFKNSSPTFHEVHVNVYGFLPPSFEIIIILFQQERSLYAAVRGPPENVDAGGAPYGKSRSRSKKQNNFSEAPPIRDDSVNRRTEKRRKRIAENEEKTKAFLSTTGSVSAIVAQDAPRLAKEAPKLSNESSKPEVETTSGKQLNWASMSKVAIIAKLKEINKNVKSASALMKMTKDNLVAYAKNPAKADKTGTAPKASIQSNVDSLVKLTTVKPGKSARAQRNKGVKA